MVQDNCLNNLLYVMHLLLLALTATFIYLMVQLQCKYIKIPCDWSPILFLVKVFQGELQTGVLSRENVLMLPGRPLIPAFAEGFTLAKDD